MVLATEARSLLPNPPDTEATLQSSTPASTCSEEARYTAPNIRKLSQKQSPAVQRSGPAHGHRSIAELKKTNSLDQHKTDSVSLPALQPPSAGLAVKHYLQHLGIHEVNGALDGRLYLTFKVTTRNYPVPESILLVLAFFPPITSAHTVQSQSGFADRCTQEGHEDARAEPAGSYRYRPYQIPRRSGEAVCQRRLCIGRSGIHIVHRAWNSTLPPYGSESVVGEWNTWRRSLLELHRRFNVYRLRRYMNRDT
ncbi:hypothetical protein BV22DRAFT_1150676 [Leucogyrophana mollusca]|uniref:Uncharacterized protein n=1 Tax=Leucogyrophana mollusca TaxID=85980 RepID=A0ACB8BS94_9AGAM|nr:hypothetical protein BV22DRAFT_1150676 [Leucogyrophana mollusca]